MIRNLKVLSIALAAAFAMSAVVASAASAEFKYHSEIDHTIITGSQVIETVTTTAFGTVKCKKATFEGTTTTKTETELTITPDLKECKAFGVNATVDINGCHYLFTTPTTFTTTGGTKDLHAEMHLECNTGLGSTIVWTAPGCEVTWPPQTPTVPTVDLKNEGAGAKRDILLTWTLTGITYQGHGLCNPSTAHKNDGSISGTITFTGEDTNKSQVGIWTGE
jgi:hypothetical protein